MSITFNADEILRWPRKSNATGRNFIVRPLKDDGFRSEENAAGFSVDGRGARKDLCADAKGIVG